MIRSPLIVFLAFMLTIVLVTATSVGCGVDESFSYSVRVLDEVTSEPIASAKVTIEIADKSPLDELTDSNGFARFIIDASRAGEPGRLLVQADGYSKHDQYIDLYFGMLPDIIPLEVESAQETSLAIPFATSTMTATSTSGPGLVIVASSATPSQSSSTPTGSVTLVVTPSPPPIMGQTLSKLLETVPTTAARLGRPKGLEVWEPGVAFQNFEHGAMLYRDALPPEVSISVLFPDGTWKSFQDKFREGMISVPQEITPPEGFYKPIRGFGITWYEEPEVLHSLGWATTCEMSMEILRQKFDEGLVIRLEIFKYFQQANPPTTCTGQQEHLGRTFVFYYSPGDSSRGTWEELTNADQ